MGDGMHQYNSGSEDATSPNYWDESSRRQSQGWRDPNNNGNAFMTGYTVTGGQPSPPAGYLGPARGGYWTTPQTPPSFPGSFVPTQRPLEFRSRPRTFSQTQYDPSIARGVEQGMERLSPIRPNLEGYDNRPQQFPFPPNSPTSPVSPDSFSTGSPRSVNIDSRVPNWGQGAPVAKICRTNEGANIVQTYRTSQAMLSSNRVMDNDPKTLYSSFKKREKPRNFFVVGKVFITWWAEPAGEVDDDTRTAITNISCGSFGQQIFSKIRRFIVIRAAEWNCSCLPISTYQGRGVSKRGTNKSEHAIIYTGRLEPEPLPEEMPSRGEGGLLLSIRVDPDRPELKLDTRSRVDFAKVYTIEHHAKVQSVGKINHQSMQVLLRQFQGVWSRNLESIGQPMRTAPMRPRDKRDEPASASDPERIAAYLALRASGWNRERACKVLFSEVGLLIPTAELDAIEGNDGEGQMPGRNRNPATDADIDNTAIS